MFREDLIKIAEKKYPIDSVFYDLVHNLEFTVKEHKFHNFGNSNQLYISVKTNKQGNNTARIFKNNVWAKTKNNLN